MSDGWWFQQGDERVVWQGRPRLSAALGSVSIGVVICGLAVAAAAIVDPRLVAGSVLGVGIAAWAVLRVRRTEYLLTTRALWLKRGVAGRTVRRVGLQKVQNTAYNQSITGSAFGYGTVTIEVAGGRDLRFRRIDDPETVQTAIVDRVGSGDEEIPGSTAQWRSVLRLVREIRTAVE
ncbi:PH domain-containing protein [Halobellus clavatus]|jgi:uncharacterized membrane protein YdbT with pleckstrin-like domain|uniref:PH domain-containing protein n=1 Tax=Halobellus clavatus TaxID=660517 RepID=A0A1H3D0T0_9EURY|nr:PH domain-containing protein [Halobellus clavatus]SDX60001.1 PH domain-containing protein [Halobellus clavatus]